MPRTRQTRPGGANEMDAIFDLWPTIADLAHDLGKKYDTVVSWRRRSRLPAECDTDMVKAAKKRGLKLTISDIAHARRAVARHGPP